MQACGIDLKAFRVLAALAALLLAGACSGSRPVQCGGGGGPYTLANLPCGAR